MVDETSNRNTIGAMNESLINAGNAADRPSAPTQSPTRQVDGADTRETTTANESTNKHSKKPAYMRRKLRYLKTAWETTPRRIRQVICMVVGASFIAIGMLLVVLPGPFTLPFVIGGLAILASEFTWAERLLDKTLAKARGVTKKIRSIGNN